MLIGSDQVVVSQRQSQHSLQHLPTRLIPGRLVECEELLLNELIGIEGYVDEYG